MISWASVTGFQRLGENEMLAIIDMTGRLVGSRKQVIFDEGTNTNGYCWSITRKIQNH